MASKWTKKVASPGMLPGGIYAIVVFIDPACGTVERLRVSGEPRPINLVMLRAKSGGRITEIGAREGRSVKACDVLVRFETEDLQSVQKQREADHSPRLSRTRQDRAGQEYLQSSGSRDA